MSVWSSDIAEGGDFQSFCPWKVVGMILLNTFGPRLVQQSSKSQIPEIALAEHLWSCSTHQSFGQLNRLDRPDWGVEQKAGQCSMELPLSVSRDWPFELSAVRMKWSLANQNKNMLKLQKMIDCYRPSLRHWNTSRCIYRTSCIWFVGCALEKCLQHPSNLRPTRSQRAFCKMRCREQCKTSFSALNKNMLWTNSWVVHHLSVWEAKMLATLFAAGRSTLQMKSASQPAIRQSNAGWIALFVFWP